MKALEEKIRREGKVLPGGVLKVGSFLNQQMDVDFLMSVGAEIARLYANAGVTKVLTVEASGIAFAVVAAAHLHVPALFAKKHTASNQGDCYSVPVESFTHHTTYQVTVDKEYLGADDVVLLVDDFLANGKALEGLISLCEQAGAKVAGCAVAVEKDFQNGGNRLRERGVRVESLARIAAMGDDGSIVFVSEKD